MRDEPRRAGAGRKLVRNRTSLATGSSEAMIAAELSNLDKFGEAAP